MHSDQSTGVWVTARTHPILSRRSKGGWEDDRCIALLDLGSEHIWPGCHTIWEYLRHPIHMWWTIEMDMGLFMSLVCGLFRMRCASRDKVVTCQLPNYMAHTSILINIVYNICCMNKNQHSLVFLHNFGRIQSSKHHYHIVYDDDPQRWCLQRACVWNPGRQIALGGTCTGFKRVWPGLPRFTNFSKIPKTRSLSLFVCL